MWYISIQLNINSIFVAFVGIFGNVEKSKSQSTFHQLCIGSQAATYQELHSQLLATENMADFDRLGLLSFPLLVIWYHSSALSQV